jgi:hypothetical protein
MYFILPSSVSKSNSPGSHRHFNQLLFYNSGVFINAATVIDQLYRAQWGRIVATLIGLLGDFHSPRTQVRRLLLPRPPVGRPAGTRQSKSLDRSDCPEQSDRQAATTGQLRRQN